MNSEILKAKSLSQKAHPYGIPILRIYEASKR